MYDFIYNFVIFLQWIYMIKYITFPWHLYTLPINIKVYIPFLILLNTIPLNINRYGPCPISYTIA